MQSCRCWGIITSGISLLLSQEFQVVFADSAQDSRGPFNFRGRWLLCLLHLACYLAGGVLKLDVQETGIAAPDCNLFPGSRCDGTYCLLLRIRFLYSII